MRLLLVDKDGKLQAEMDAPSAPSAVIHHYRAWVKDETHPDNVYREVATWPLPPEERYGPYPQQTRWFELREKFGDDGAYKELARRMRQAADHLDKLSEKRGWPDVFGCEYPAAEPMCSDGHFIDGIGVTLSFPWPG